MVAMIEDQNVLRIEKLVQIVKDAGGTWIGIQMPFVGYDPTPEPVVLFSDPSSILSFTLPVSQVSVENVKAKIRRHGPKTTCHPCEKIRTLATKLREIADELEKSTK